MSLSAPLKTTDDAPDYAVLLNGDPTTGADADGDDRGGYVETHATLDGEPVRVSVSFSDDGVTGVSVIVHDDLTINLTAADEQPESGLKYDGGALGVEAVVRILPATEVDG